MILWGIDKIFDFTGVTWKKNEALTAYIKLVIGIAYLALAFYILYGLLQLGPISVSSASSNSTIVATTVTIIKNGTVVINTVSQGSSSSIDSDIIALGSLIVASVAFSYSFYGNRKIRHENRVRRLLDPIKKFRATLVKLTDVIPRLNVPTTKQLSELIFRILLWKVSS